VAPAVGDRYFRGFLSPLFFEGFAKKAADRAPQTNQLLGDVPYLNGGLFQQHEIEKAHGEDLQIADAAFDRLYEFCEGYQWHLDDRPLRNDNEINPDVLGYIFEKYINQKQMGAYYTKEDITEYISKNTVIPFLLDAARERCKVAFETEPARKLATTPNPSPRQGQNQSSPGDSSLDPPRPSPRQGQNENSPVASALGPRGDERSRSPEGTAERVDTQPSLQDSEEVAATRGPGLKPLGYSRPSLRDEDQGNADGDDGRPDPTVWRLLADNPDRYTREG